MPRAPLGVFAVEESHEGHQRAVRQDDDGQGEEHPGGDPPGQAVEAKAVLLVRRPAGADALAKPDHAVPHDDRRWGLGNGRLVQSLKDNFQGPMGTAAAGDPGGGELLLLRWAHFDHFGLDPGRLRHGKGLDGDGQGRDRPIRFVPRARGIRGAPKMLKPSCQEKEEHPSNEDGLRARFGSFGAGKLWR